MNENNVIFPPVYRRRDFLRDAAFAIFGKNVDSLWLEPKLANPPPLPKEINSVSRSSIKD
jgi:hypothetical protein